MAAQSVCRGARTVKESFGRVSCTNVLLTLSRRRIKFTFVEGRKYER
jgi:hypothetical protein